MNNLLMREPIEETTGFNKLRFLHCLRVTVSVMAAADALQVTPGFVLQGIREDWIPAERCDRTWRVFRPWLDDFCVATERIAAETRSVTAAESGPMTPPSRVPRPNPGTDPLPNHAPVRKPPRRTVRRPTDREKRRANWLRTTVDVAEAAGVLGLTPDQVVAGIVEGWIRAHRLDHAWRIDWRHLEQLIDSLEWRSTWLIP